MDLARRARIEASKRQWSAADSTTKPVRPDATTTTTPVTTDATTTTTPVTTDATTTTPVTKVLNAFKSKLKIKVEKGPFK